MPQAVEFPPPKWRSRLALLLLLLAGGTALVAVNLTGVRGGSQSTGDPSPTLSQQADGFEYAAGTGPVLGNGGSPQHFHVATEERQIPADQTPAAVAASVEAILGDAKSWIADPAIGFQRVPRNVDAEFTIYLASPATSERMCAAGGLQTDRYTSCQLPGQVIINSDRWMSAVPGYGAPLTEYRAYSINHEVGHQLGHRHEACPASGQPAPVMQQQTLGLDGCTAYGWPYLDGQRYAGPPAP